MTLTQLATRFRRHTRRPRLTIADRIVATGRLDDNLSDGVEHVDFRPRLTNHCIPCALRDHGRCTCPVIRCHGIHWRR